MIIGVAGKGGIGKSTVSALYAQWLAEQGRVVAAVDADVNQQLGLKFGLSKRQLASSSTLTDGWRAVARYLAGDNEAINRAGGPDTFVKTTPPGHGSRRFWLDLAHPILSILFHEVAIKRETPAGQKVDSRIHFARAGDLGPEDTGRCYHSKVHCLEALLTHYVSVPQTMLLLDMLAGGDNTATSILPQCDDVVVVCSAGEDSLQVLEQHVRLAEKRGPASLNLVVVGNQIYDDEIDLFKSRIAPFEERLGAQLLPVDTDGRPFVLGHSDAIRRASRDSGPIHLGMLSDEEMRLWPALDALAGASVLTPEERADRAVHFHRLNAADSKNSALLDQIDPEYRPGVEMLAALLADRDFQQHCLLGTESLVPQPAEVSMIGPRFPRVGGPHATLPLGVPTPAGDGSRGAAPSL